MQADVLTCGTLRVTARGSSRPSLPEAVATVLILLGINLVVKIPEYWFHVGIRSIDETPCDRP